MSSMGRPEIVLYTANARVFSPTNWPKRGIGPNLALRAVFRAGRVKDRARPSSDGLPHRADAGFQETDKRAWTHALQALSAGELGIQRTGRQGGEIPLSP